MNIVAAVLAPMGLLVASAAAAADGSPPARQERNPATEPGLRQVLHDFIRQEPSPPPRQLSPGERAELRRQLSEQPRPVSRRH